MNEEPMSLGTREDTRARPTRRQTMGDQDLELFRKEKDEFFRTDPHSPLTPEQRPAFRGLAYYPEEPELRIEGRLDPPPEEGEVRMPTSTGGEQVYRRAGVVRFSVEGRAAEITLYAASGDHELFLPFRDATSGQETYPAGRYLAVERPTGGRVVIDFNHAYNPYCAYNERWSCPLPPPENWLEVPIRAGERDFPLRAH
jgi:uncharacterized protein (DUF1684 family)